MKYAFVFLLVIISILIAGCQAEEKVVDQNSEVTDTQKAPEISTVVEITSDDELIVENTYSLDEVSMHSSSDDCWMAIDGLVYDVTDMIGSHPGGETILDGCGIDATEFFETRPMGSGTPHSERARNWRDKYQIGVLG